MVSFAAVENSSSDTRVSSSESDSPSEDDVVVFRRAASSLGRGFEDASTVRGGDDERVGVADCVVDSMLNVLAVGIYSFIHVYAVQMYSAVEVLVDAHRLAGLGKL